jgi:undecaprenyl pyrophosphate phosphatase UppP
MEWWADLSFWKGLLLAAIQGLAAIPGISRLGMTLGLGLFFGLSWREALKLL